MHHRSFFPMPLPMGSSSGRDRSAVETLRQDSDDDGGAILDWWPAMGAISRSGDLALSVGPWTFQGLKSGAHHGYHAAIWRRQSDGSWKFLVDGAGAGIDRRHVRAKGSMVDKLPVSKSIPRLSPGAVLVEVRSIETRMATAVMQDARAAMAEHVAEDAWVMGSRTEGVPGRSGWSAELLRRPAKLGFQYIGGAASAAGDMVYTYGAAVSADPGKVLEGTFYVRVWLLCAGLAVAGQRLADRLRWAEKPPLMKRPASMGNGAWQS